MNPPGRIKFDPGQFGRGVWWRNKHPAKVNLVNAAFEVAPWLEDATSEGRPKFSRGPRPPSSKLDWLVFSFRDNS